MGRSRAQDVQNVVIKQNEISEQNGKLVFAREKKDMIRFKWKLVYCTHLIAEYGK